MKKLLFLFILIVSNSGFSQVGINTNIPKATLEVVGEPGNVSKMDVIIIPQITGEQLASKTYSADQTGAIIYVTSAATTLSGQVINVDGAGFYYYDGTKWMKAAPAAESVNIYNSNGSLTGNRTGNLNGNWLNFSGSGYVGIGGVDPLAKLNVNGFIQFGPIDSHYGVGRVVNDNVGEKYGLTQSTYFPAIGIDGSSPGTRIYTSGRSGVTGHISFGKYTSPTAYTEWARFADDTGYFGINTYDPKASFEIKSSPGNTNRIDGLIGPKLTGNQLKAKDALYDVDQSGAIVYVTAAVTSSSAKTVNVTKTGYYYFDGSVWISFK